MRAPEGSSFTNSFLAWYGLRRDGAGGSNRNDLRGCIKAATPQSSQIWPQQCLAGLAFNFPIFDEDSNIYPINFRTCLVCWPMRFWPYTRRAAHIVVTSSGDCPCTLQIVFGWKIPFQQGPPCWLRPFMRSSSTGFPFCSYRYIFCSSPRRHFLRATFFLHLLSISCIMLLLVTLYCLVLF